MLDPLRARRGFDRLIAKENENNIVSNFTSGSAAVVRRGTGGIGIAEWRGIPRLRDDR